MTIELIINENEDILLTPIRKSAIGENKVIYSLIDKENFEWIELELKNNSFIIINKDIRVSDKDIKTKLDNLVLLVIESEQSGTDNTENYSTEESNPYDPEKIKVHSKQFSIKLISEMIDMGDIDLKPDFQRHLVWDNHQKSRLIESILLRIPLPMFYFSEDDEGKISIVDGLQRISTIKDFMDNKFPLKGLQYLRNSCDGCFYSNKNNDGSLNDKKVIEPKYLRWFNMTQFSVNVIDPSSPAKVKYDIFRRINTGGKPLNNQEIRNSLAGKNLRDTLKNMVGLKEFKTATDYSIKEKRMDDQEIALRFILFSKYFENNNLEDYNGYIDTLLDDLTEDLNKIKKEELNKYTLLFSNAMKNAEYLIGNKYAFRKIASKDILPNAYKQLINKALFVSLSVLLATHNPDKIKELNQEKSLLDPLIKKIEEDKKLHDYLSYGTNGKANLLYVFKEIKYLILEIVKI